MMRNFYNLLQKGFFVVWLVTVCQVAVAQQRDITGVVMSTEGEILPGATVSVKGTTIGATTSADGKFLLKIPADAQTLVASYIGYQLLEMPVGAKTYFEFKLEADISSLNEVVVIGYGEVKKSDLTGAVTTVSPKDFNSGVVLSPAQLLQGRVAGLTISKAGGDPTQGSSIQLRGPSTLGTQTSPLFVIDGVPGASLDLIAPEDIVSMDVARDAASTAIYGTRAANGVIFVKTRRGKAGQTTINYHVYGGLEKVAKDYDMASTDEVRAYLTSKGKSFTVADDDNANTNWQKVITQDSYSQNHNLSFGGGNENSHYQASFSYFDRPGVVKTSGYNRTMGRLALDHNMFNNKVRLGATISNSVSNGTPVNYKAFEQALRYLPVTNVYEADGKYSENTARPFYFNPLAILEQNTETYKTSVLLGTAQLGVTLLPGLTFDAIGTVQRDITERALYQSVNSTYARVNNSNFNSGFGAQNYTTFQNKILELFLGYSKTFGIHDLRLTAGYSFQQDNYKGLQAVTNGYISDDLGVEGYLAANPSTSFTAYLTGNAGDDYRNFYPKSNSQNRLVSYYGRAIYTLSDKYILQAVLRRDGSSRFGENNKWGFFPAVSAAWKLSSENFMQDLSLLSDLKLRVGWGVSGNQGLNPYQSLVRYGRTTGAVFVNGAWTSSYSQVQNANPDLKWETTTTLNAGIDFSLWQNRVTGSIDIYNKNTKDMLFLYNVPSPPYPVNTIFANAGEMVNKGIEVAMTGNVINKEKFKWSVSLNLAHNKNEVKSLSNNLFSKTEDLGLGYGGSDPGLQGASFQTTQVLRPGLAVGTFYMYEYAGIDANGNRLYYNKNGEAVSKVDNKQDDYRILGSALPKFTYGLTQNFNYGSFGLTLFFRGVSGNKIFNAMAANLDRLADASSINVSKAALAGGYTGTPFYSSYYLENGSYLRLDNVTLSYKIPQFVNALKNATVYFATQNVFTITKFSGVDPELDYSGRFPGIVGVGKNGINPTYYRTRSFTLGLNVTF